MSATTSGLLLMTVGMMFVGGAYSFYKQKITWVAQAVLLLVGLAFAGYGLYVVMNYSS
ncbi:hypothetical protein [Rothia nasimurium]|uniref:hypothetical protein n=1 Tax=Rothia nasimurium TaxID=85336 RepID=UPI001F3EACB5|nr:hypothetical protein [Rothia nasimurium]